jgi:hypothetical protein
MKLKFYPTLRFLILLMLAACFGTESFSQSCAGLTATYSVTESRCIATGSIQVTASGGSGTYNYRVTGPSSTGFTSSNVITGLQPGNYMITVKDIISNCVINVNNVMIAGTYQDPRFSNL